MLLRTSFLILLALAQISFGQLSGPLSGTLGPGMFHVTDTIFVLAGESLTLLPSTAFIFDGSCALIIFGVLIAEGTEGDTIKFTTDRPYYICWWRGIEFNGAEASGSRLAYCVVENACRPDESGESRVHGGGIRCISASPVFSCCSIRHNRSGSFEPPEFYGDGAGMYCFHSSPRLTSCTFSANEATGDGGAVFCTEDSLVFDSCNFLDNFAWGCGGAVRGTASHKDCLFERNTTHIRGGGAVNGRGVFAGCTFRNNRAEFGGGGGAVEGGGVFSCCNIESNSSMSQGGGVVGEGRFTNCRITGNHSLDGGGVYTMGNSQFVDCFITHNGADGYGGGVCATGNSSFLRCIISHNSAGDAGAGVGSGWPGGTADLINCILAGNTVVNYDLGGVVQIKGSLVNCTVSGNSAHGFEVPPPAVEIVGLTYVSNTIVAFNDARGISFWSAAGSSVNHCDVFANAGEAFTGSVPAGVGVNVTTNINGDSCDVFYNVGVDPLFADTGGEDLHLTDLSHCIGAGDPSDPLPTDMDGNPRPNPPGSNPDIGAFESPLAAPAETPCEAGPDTLFVRPEQPGVHWEYHQCIPLCQDHTYIVVVPVCARIFPQYGHPLIHVIPGCDPFSTLCDNAGCSPGGAAVIGEWSMIPGAPAWYATVSLHETGIEGCACLFLEMGPPEHPWEWTGDCWLSVELLSLEAAAESEGIRLRFSTASEANNDYFEILRGTSQNGSFRTIVRIPSQGNSSSEQQYQYLDRDVTAGEAYWYYLADVSLDGTRTEHRDRMVSAVWHEAAALPESYALTAYPNPFNPFTTVGFDLPEKGTVQIQVYDIAGRWVRDLCNRDYPAGRHSIRFDAGDLPSGMYLARLKAGTFSLSHKLVLIR